MPEYGPMSLYVNMRTELRPPSRCYMHEHCPCCVQSGLSSLVLRKKRALTAAFTQVDKEGDGYVTKDKWCKVMDNVSVTCCCSVSRLSRPPSFTAIVIDTRARGRSLLLGVPAFAFYSRACVCVAVKAKEMRTS